MFKSARIKLTSYYLIIIMLITISFSTVVYIGVDRNTRHALEGQLRRMQSEYLFFSQGRYVRVTPFFDIETLHEIRERTIMNLAVINLAVFAISGTLAYFLAGKTLEPIEEMVKKQKRFISDAAHEIKTPLTAMKTNLEVTLRDKNLTLTESKEALISTIEEVDKLNKFTNRLLKQSKYQNGNNGHKEIQLDKILTRVVSKVEPLANTKNIKINIETETTGMKGNEEELDELFTNVIENAIKYSKANEEISISSKKYKNHVDVTVEDHGIGISEEDLTHIFEPFYRADKARTDSEHEGYGLGLAIAKEIVDRHRGKLHVESKLNEGTKFIITLPLSNFSE